MRRRSPALTNAGSAIKLKVTTTGSLDRSLGDPGDIPAALRRRKRASFRLPPMPDGRRDPLESDPADRPAHIEARRLAWCHLHRLGLLDENTDAILRGVA